MPFSPTTKRFGRVWQFINRFVVGSNADRSDFDIAFDDLATGLNDAIIYLEGRDDAIAVSATDLRYIGSFAANPTTRVGGAALVAADFYFNNFLQEFRVWTGSAFVTTTGLTTATRAFLALIEADDDASVRNAIGLGTAAVQNISAFASAAQGVKADAAVRAPSGIAVNVLDWLDVHALGTGIYEGGAGAANAPVALAGRGIYLKQSTTSGTLIVAMSNDALYMASHTGTALGPWRSIGSVRGLVTDLNVLKDGFGVFTYAQTATGAEVISAVPTYSAIGIFWGNGTIAKQVAFVPGAGMARIRVYASGAWGAWQEMVTSANVASYVGASIAAQAYDAVGSYLFCALAAANHVVGGLQSGSNIRPAGYAVTGSGGYVTTQWTSALPGTWMCCGKSPGQPGVYEGITLWRRVA